eukprot:7371520-Prymnesium_polylepis.1
MTSTARRRTYTQHIHLTPHTLTLPCVLGLDARCLCTPTARGPAVSVARPRRVPRPRAIRVPRPVGP